MKKFLFAFMFFVPAMLFAAIGQNGISMAPDGTLLKWEEGAWDFFIMHKTAIDIVTGAANDEQNPKEKNPQADSFVDPNVGTTYTLEPKHIPPDANIDRAFLAWLSTQDPDNLAGPTNNSVTLTFTNAADPSITLSRQITASMQGNLATTTIGNFEYEALNMPDYQTGNTGVYTYRVEVSDFMKEIIAMGEAAGMKSGEALYGQYNVKGIVGSNHQNYLTTSGLVGGWFLPFVYTSSNISAKKIYFYNGLAAYRDASQIITVSGFELPDEAIIKLGLVVFEGDPGLYSALFSHMEGLSISSETEPNNFAPLFNDCNPNLGSYTEMYNSISSIFSWEDSNNYWCVGDPQNLLSTTNPIEYAIDADILVVDASPDGPFYNRFVKGDKSINLQIGANQDQVYTNLLIVSVDTKLPDFDIPNEREKHYCSCSTDEDAVCSDRPFYYTIKVQNHGQNVANGVKLQDTLPPQVEYVAGTTEIATKFDAQGNGTDWTAVPDVDNNFPFANSKEVAPRLEHCNNGICEEETTVWVRFQVRPKANLSKNEIIRNDAVISSDDSGTAYHTNSNIPLRLKLGKCPTIAECTLPPKAQCGGVRIEGNDNYCAEDKDCKDGKKCVNNECILDASTTLTTDAKISFDMGKDSPGSGNSNEIIIPSPSEKLVLGQFYLLSEGDTGKYYNLNKINLKFTKDSDISAKNFKLYKDKNGNGKLDEGDIEISSAEFKNSSVELSITDDANRLNDSGVKNYFIVTADVETTATSAQPGKFSMTIEGPESFSITDNGNPIISGKRTDFAIFRFEPAEGFVFTTGQYDPQVPSYKDFNGEHEMLQVRTKSKGAADKIKTIKVKTSNSFAKFGEGIKSITLILDRDGNGVQSEGDTVIQKVDNFDSTTSMSFENLDDLLQYAENEEKYLIFKVEFKMNVGETAKITVSDVKVGSGKAVGTPVASKEFTYECDSTDPTSCASDDDEGGSGCAISAVEGSDSSTFYIIFAAFAALLALAGVRVFASKK